MQEDPFKTEIESGSIEKYMEYAKEINWHIDEKEFPKLQKLREFNFDEQFNQYIDALLSKKCPWEEANLQFVNTVWEKNEYINKFGFIFTGGTLILVPLGLFIGYILNDVVGALFLIHNGGTAIGNLITLGVIIALVGFFPGVFLAAILEGFTVSPPNADRRINRLKILSNDQETARKILLFLSIIITGWLIYFVFLRQYFWKDLVNQQAVLSFNYHMLFGICIVLVLLLIKKKELVRMNTEKNINALINQNRDLMNKAIVHAKEYKM